MSCAKIHFSHCSGSDTYQRHSMLIAFWNAFETKKAHNFCYRYWISRHFYVTFNIRFTMFTFATPQHCYTAPEIHPPPLLTSFPPCLIVVSSCCHAFSRSAQWLERCSHITVHRSPFFGVCNSSHTGCCSPNPTGECTSSTTGNNTLKKKKRRMFSQLDESIGNPKKAAFKETEIFVGS